MKVQYCDTEKIIVEMSLDEFEELTSRRVADGYPHTSPRYMIGKVFHLNNFKIARDNIQNLISLKKKVQGQLGEISDIFDSTVFPFTEQEFYRDSEVEK